MELRSNLPQQLTSFVGRRRELLELESLLPGSGLLSILGTGGSGKTRLALELARATAGAYPDGVWLIELAALTDPGLLPLLAAAAIGLQEDPKEPPVPRLVAYLRKRQVLLVLDNCEHLLPACNQLGAALLAGCPHLAILATSREPIRLPSERVWFVPPLSLPDEASDIAGSEAVQLLLERAKAHRSSLALSHENACAVAHICRQLDGLPLAIELAAARMNVLTPQQIAERLTHRYQLLTHGHQAALPRQQTLRALVDWSHDLLSEPARRLFRRLSVFAGGWTLEAAEAVCTGEQDLHSADVLDVLSELVDKSLVLAEPHGDEMRYHMLETLREYAAEKLDEAGERALLSRQHFAWFSELADRWEDAWRRLRCTSWFARLEQEHDNLRLALEWSSRSQDTLEDGLSMAASLWWFWWLRGFVGEGRQRLDRLLSEQNGSRTETVGRARASIGSGALAMYQLDLVAARSRLEAAADLGRQLNRPEVVATALVPLGVVLHYMADARADSVLRDSLVMGEDLGDSRIVFFSLYGLALIAQAGGDYEQAAELNQRLLDLAGQAGDEWSIAFALHRLGCVLLAKGDLTSARTALQECLARRVRMGERVGSAYVLETLAMLAVAEHQPGRAVRLYGAARAQREVTGAALPPTEQADIDRRLEPAYGQLDERQVAEALAAGRAMSPEAAAAYESLPETKHAVTAVPDAARAAQAPPHQFGPSHLTRREEEVLRLLASGASNKDIARQLVLSIRTVERHIANVYQKIGAHGRVGAASYAAQRWGDGYSISIA